MNANQELDPQSIVEEGIKKLGRANILLVGKTGVGKSTLINSIFKGNFAETGVGRPVSSNIKEITKPDVPISLFDTRGFELANEVIGNDILSFVKSRKTDNPLDHIGIAWYCISNTSHRIEPYESSFIKELSSNDVKVIVVLTQTHKVQDKELYNEIKNDLFDTDINIVRVLAQDYYDDLHWGLESLVEATHQLIPDAQKNAFDAAQKISLDHKVQNAHKVVAAAAASAMVTGASPIPFSDAILLAPAQVGMLASISAVMGLNLDKGFLMTLLSSTAGVAGATAIGKTIVTNILKCIPGAGTLVGGTISAVTAGTLTTIMGEAYIAAVVRLIKNNTSKAISPEEIAAEFKRTMSNSKL